MGNCKTGSHHVWSKLGSAAISNRFTYLPYLQGPTGKQWNKSFRKALIPYGFFILADIFRVKKTNDSSPVLHILRICLHSCSNRSSLRNECAISSNSHRQNRLRQQMVHQSLIQLINHNILQEKQEKKIFSQPPVCSWSSYWRCYVQYFNATKSRSRKEK